MADYTHECFICFEDATHTTQGTLFHLKTEGCRCNPLVHERCILRWYTGNGRGRNECPICKTTGIMNSLIPIMYKYNTFPELSYEDNDEYDEHDDDELNNRAMIYNNNLSRKIYSIIAAFIIIVCYFIILYNCIQ